MLMTTPYELEKAVYDRQRHLVRMAELARAWRAVTRREQRPAMHDATPSRIAIVQ